MNALVILNPMARQGTENFEQGLEVLRRRGLNPQVEITECAEEIPTLIGRCSSDCDRVIVAGGDGTLNCAIEGLLACGLPLGIMPLGTANDLARTLGIPFDLEEACEVAAGNRIRRIDLGHVNNRYFFNAAHIGLGARITRTMSHQAKKGLGILAYFHSFLLAYRSNVPFDADVLCDGVEHRLRSIQLGIGNGRHYGGGMVVSEDAEPDDHLLDLYSLAPQSLFRLATLAYALRTGRYRGRKKVTALRGSEIEIRTDPPMEIDMDGETGEWTPAVFRIERCALPVLVPEEAVEEVEGEI